MKKTISILVLLLLVLSFVGCNSSDYKKAVELQNAGNYSEAVVLFEKLGEYEDSAKRLVDCKNIISYNNGLELQKNEKYEEAIAVFSQLGDYNDSAARLSECKNMVSYNKAVGLLNNKDYSEAAAIFQGLSGFLDSDSRFAFCNEMTAAIDAFNLAISSLNNKNTAFDNVIASAVDISTTNEKALDESLRESLQTAISDAKKVRVTASEMPDTAAEILELANALSSVDYKDATNNLTVAQENFEKSLKQYALVNNPSEEYVISCLQTIPGILTIEAATEDRDPNGQLHKAGGYTSAVYFYYDKVKDSYVVDLVKKEGLIGKTDSSSGAGTDAGGQIEVYASESDAKRRNDYLSGFDGTWISPGGHKVVGTCVVRTSNKLTATQQKELEALIIEALTKLK